MSAKVTLGEITEIRGVIFDMDGTLTLPVLRFAEMKEKLGLKPTDDILPTVQKFPPEERAKAFEIIEEFEREGVENMKVQLIPYYYCTEAIDIKGFCSSIKSIMEPQCYNSQKTECYKILNVQ